MRRVWSFGLLLAAVLGVSAAAATSVHAAPAAWIASRDLIARSPTAFERLDKAGLDAVIRRLPSELSQIPDFLRAASDGVRLHKGDLIIDGSLANTHTLVVDGNLTIRGRYDDYRDGIGILVVLGDLRAEHVVSWGSIAVTGTLEASGLVYAYYNDFTFEVTGPVRARAVVIFDKSTNDPRIETTVRQSDDGDGADLAVRHFVPELMIDDVLDKADPAATTLQAVASYDGARARIAAGAPVFRERPATEGLPADVLRLLGSRVDAATMRRLAKADRLLALVIAAGESIPIDVQRYLVETGDAAVLERLAANPNTDRAIARRIRGGRRGKEAPSRLDRAIRTRAECAATMRAALDERRADDSTARCWAAYREAPAAECAQGATRRTGRESCAGPTIRRRGAERQREAAAAERVQGATDARSEGRAPGRRFDCEVLGGIPRSACS